MKKIIAIMLSFVLGFSIVGCQAGTEVEKRGNEDNKKKSSTQTRMAMIIPLATQDIFNYITAQLEYEAEKKGIEITIWNVNGDVALIGERVSMAYEQGYDAVFVIDPTGAAKTAIEEVKDKIVVIGYDAVVTPELMNAWVSTDNVAMGEKLAEHMIEDMRGKDKDTFNVMLSYTPTVQSEIDRAKGMKEVIDAEKELNIQYEEVTNSKTSLEGKVSLWDDILIRKEKGEIDYVLASNSYNALGCISAAEAAGRTEFSVMGIDDEDDQLAALQKKKNNLYKATIAQNPFQMGKDMMDAALKALDGENVGNVNVDSEVVTNENVEKYLSAREKNIDALSKYISDIKTSGN